MLQAGDLIPDFVLPSDTMGDVSASSLRGQRYVLYFYPKDDTSGCTTEACNFRDNLASFNALNIPVFGVSPDNIKAHAKFRAKFGLTFPLLSDNEHKVAAAFGAWVEKSMYGRKYMGIQRSTFIIGPAGMIERVWAKVTPAEHARDVLAYLNFLPASAANENVATESVDEPAARAAAVEEIVITQTEVTEVETETVNKPVSENVPEPVVETPRKPARKRRPAKAPAAPAAAVETPVVETAPETVEFVVVESVVEVPGEPPIEVIDVFAVEPAPAPEPTPAVAVKKPAVKKPAPAAKKPAAAVKKPAAAAKKAVAKKPAPAAKKPTPAAKKPAAAKKAVAKKSAPAAKKPATVVKKPATAAKKPAAAVKKPAPAAKKSTAKR